MAGGQPHAAARAAGGADGRRVAAGHAGPAPAPFPADEREAGLRPVECGRCGAAALVAKFSPQHTSVQWSLASARACAEFAARAAAGEVTALIDTCASMRASIDRAVDDGRLEVSPP